MRQTLCFEHKAANPNSINNANAPWLIPMNTESCKHLFGIKTNRTGLLSHMDLDLHLTARPDQSCSQMHNDKKTAFSVKLPPQTCCTSLWNTQENGHSQLKGFPVSTEIRKHQAIGHKTTTESIPLKINH